MSSFVPLVSVLGKSALSCVLRSSNRYASQSLYKTVVQPPPVLGTPLTAMTTVKPKIPITLTRNKESLLRELKDHHPIIKGKLLKDWLAGPTARTAQIFSNVIDEMIEVNGGQCRFALSVMQPLSILQPDMTASELEKACAISWLNEYGLIFWNFTDDIMDNNKVRKGSPCWHVKYGNGTAVADMNLLNSIIYKGITLYFHDHPKFSGIYHVTDRSMCQTNFGQRHDIEVSTTLDNRNCHTMSVWESIIKLNSSDNIAYLFRVPFYVAGHGDNELHVELHDIGTRLGSFYKATDDYMDVFVDIKRYGVRGSDISEGRVTWLTARAMELASLEQKEEFSKHIGVRTEESVSKIVQLFEELNIVSEFNRYRETEYAGLLSQMEATANRWKLPVESMTPLLNELYERTTMSRE